MQKINWRWLGIGGLLLILPFLRFWPLWHPDPSLRFTFAYGDFIEQQYLWRVSAALAMRAGQWPMWDLFTYSGRPELADLQTATLYPLSWWQMGWPFPLPSKLLEAEGVFHLALAGWFCFGLMYQLTRRLEAALLTAITFSLGGYLTAYPLLQTAILKSAIWLPLGLWLTEISLTRQQLIWMTGAGLTLGLSILGGHPQTTMFMAYTLMLYITVRSISFPFNWKIWLARLGLCGLMAIGISALQWLPTLELLQRSARATVPYEQISVGFTWPQLLGFLRYNANEWTPLFTGWPTLILAGMEVYFAVSQRCSKSLFWVGLTPAALVISLGATTPIFYFVYQWLPGFQIFRAQEHLAFIVNFGMCILAGFGLAKLASWPKWQTWMSGVILILATTSIWGVNSQVNPVPPPAKSSFTPTPATEFLTQQANRDTWRVSSEGLLPGGGNAGLYWRVRDVTGNTPLFLGMYGFFFDTVPEVRWWQVLNVRYVLTHRAIEYPGLKLVLEDAERDQRLYQLDLGGAPVWITHAYEVAPDQASAIGRTADLETLDPLTTAVLESEPQPAPQLAAEISTEFARITAFSAHRLTAEVNLTAPGVVVLSEIDYPGWNVYVNGQPAQSLRAFGLLRAVALPAGTFTLEWRFESWPFYLGATVSLLTVLSLTVAVWQLRQRRSA